MSQALRVMAIVAVVLLLIAGTMLIDLDHLLIDPIFDPSRCSIL